MTFRARVSRRTASAELVGDVRRGYREDYDLSALVRDTWSDAGDRAQKVARRVDGNLGAAIARYRDEHPDSSHAG